MPSLDINSLEDSLKEGSKRDINVAKFIIDNVIGGIEDTVVKKEEQRDYKMKSILKNLQLKNILVDFEREKDLFLCQQNEYKQKIESTAMSNMNEKMINYMKDEKNNQQDLYNKYYTLNVEIVDKINKMKDNMPEYEDKVVKKKEKLKEVNHENLRLLERINEFETEKKENGSLIIKGNSSESMIRDEMSGNIMDYSSSSRINNITKAKKNINSNNTFNTNNNNQSINITELIEDSDQLKEKFAFLKSLKEKLRVSKKENKFLSNEIAKLNSLFFNLAKIFTEGSHEISKELLKIHEIQLDKIIQSRYFIQNNKLFILENSNGNSLYFELIKDRIFSNMNGSYNILDDQMKLPVINSNIQKKYNYPLHEKSVPSTSLYNVIKNILDEHHSLNRSLIIKKKKFEWEEFKNFSAYQMYTLISLNKEVIKNIENTIFPRKFKNLIEDTALESINRNNFNEN